MNENEDFTTIRIKKSTREILQNMGKKGETYDDIITRLIDIAKKYLVVQE